MLSPLLEHTMNPVLNLYHGQWAERRQEKDFQQGLLHKIPRAGQG